MSIVKLKHKNPLRYNQSVILPKVGETKINKEGILEVEDVVATILLNSSENYELVEGNGTTITKEKDKKPEVKKDQETEDDSKKPEDKDPEIEDLKSKSLAELIKIAKDSGIPKEEYSKFSKKKPLMVNFLEKQLK